MPYKKNKIWKQLNGKKTAIGTALAFIYGGALYIGLIDRIEIAEHFITVVLGVGLAHKATKNSN